MHKLLVIYCTSYLLQPNYTVHSLLICLVKGPVQCFSTQVVMTKCFLLNPEKNSRRSVLSFSSKTQNPLYSDALQFWKKSVTERSRRL